MERATATATATPTTSTDASRPHASAGSPEGQEQPPVGRPRASHFLSSAVVSFDEGRRLATFLRRYISSRIEFRIHGGEYSAGPFGTAKIQIMVQEQATLYPSEKRMYVPL